MNIEDIAEHTEQLIEKHMQCAINEEDEFTARLYLNWAQGARFLWSELSTLAVKQEQDLAQKVVVNKFVDSVTSRIYQMTDMKRIPSLRSTKD